MTIFTANSESCDNFTWIFTENITKQEKTIFFLYIYCIVSCQCLGQYDYFLFVISVFFIHLYAVFLTNKVAYLLRRTDATRLPRPWRTFSEHPVFYRPIIASVPATRHGSSRCMHDYQAEPVTSVSIPASSSSSAAAAAAEANEQSMKIGWVAWRDRVTNSDDLVSTRRLLISSQMTRNIPPSESETGSSRVRTRIRDAAL